MINLTLFGVPDDAVSAEANLPTFATASGGPFEPQCRLIVEVLGFKRLESYVTVYPGVPQQVVLYKDHPFARPEVIVNIETSNCLI